MCIAMQNQPGSPKRGKGEPTPKKLFSADHRKVKEVAKFFMDDRNYDEFKLPTGYTTGEIRMGAQKAGADRFLAILLDKYPHLKKVRKRDSSKKVGVGRVQMSMLNRMTQGVRNAQGREEGQDFLASLLGQYTFKDGKAVRSYEPTTQLQNLPLQWNQATDEHRKKFETAMPVLFQEVNAVLDLGRFPGVKKTIDDLDKAKPQSFEQSLSAYAKPFLQIMAGQNAPVYQRDGKAVIALFRRVFMTEVNKIMRTIDSKWCAVGCFAITEEEELQWVQKNYKSFYRPVEVCNPATELTTQNSAGASEKEQLMNEDGRSADDKAHEEACRLFGGPVETPGVPPGSPEREPSKEGSPLPPPTPGRDDGVAKKPKKPRLLK